MKSERQSLKDEFFDFSGPNMTRKFQTGHLRRTIINGSLSDLHDRGGFDVDRMSHLDDQGCQRGLFTAMWVEYESKGRLKDDLAGHLFNAVMNTNLKRSSWQVISQISTSLGFST